MSRQVLKLEGPGPELGAVQGEVGQGDHNLGALEGDLGGGGGLDNHELEVVVRGPLEGNGIHCLSSCHVCVPEGGGARDVGGG